MEQGTSAPTARDRLVAAAFELFAGRGFERTTVDDIAQQAGVGRTTFFRTFQTKEAVIFPDHDAIIAMVETRLAAADARSAGLALSEASRIVLRHYLAEGDIARARYGLTRAVSALRDAEITGQRRYQLLFGGYLRTWLEETGATNAGLRAEVVASAVVSAHNHILRQWLRSKCSDAEAEQQLDDAVRDLTGRLLQPARHTDNPGGQPEAVVVLHTSSDLAELLPRLRRLVEG